MANVNFIFFVFIIIITATTKIIPVYGGMCWSSMVKDNLCKESLGGKMSREKCCSDNDLNTAWTDGDLNDEQLFRLRVLGDGVPCAPCRESCKNVTCNDDMKCIMKNGRPQCICAPKCKHKIDGIKQGPVCGRDGRSYKSLCRLKKRACRTSNKLLTVNYHGMCQSSCKNVKCASGEYCVQDQNLQAHCVKCDQYCSLRGSLLYKRICGSDGHTYDNLCHLKQMSCHRGKAIQIAYKGRCKRNATCSTIHCEGNQKCVTDVDLNKPICMDCSICPKNKSLKYIQNMMGGPICATNNQTYDSWCYMVQDSCALGYVINAKHAGYCSNTSLENQI